LERVLQDERINRAGFQIINQVRAGIETDQDYLARKSFLFDRLHRADGGRFVGGEEAVEVWMRGQDVGRAVERLGAVGLAVLEGHDLYAGILLLDRVLKALLALVGRDRTGFDAEERDLTFAAKFFGQ